MVLTTSENVTPAASSTAREVAQRPFGLCLDTLDELPARGIEPDLAGAVDGARHGDRLAVRPDGGRGACAGDGLAGHGRVPSGIVVATTVGSPTPSGGRRPGGEGLVHGRGRGRGVVLRRIEGPQRRARAGQADGAAEDPEQRPAERDEAGQHGRGRRQEVVGRRKDARAVEEVLRAEARADLAGEVFRAHPDRPVAPAAALGKGR